MIDTLDVELFKCFQKISLPLGGLTLLSGTNASGKSTVLQAVVLLHQTMREHEWSSRLMLNGKLLKLGTVLDIVDKVNGRNRFCIGIQSGDNSYRWRFFGDRTEMSMSVEELSVNGKEIDVNESLRFLLPPELNTKPLDFTESMLNLTYITAERLGPREFYPIEDVQNAMVVGCSGEHAVSLLHVGRDKDVPEGLRQLGSPPTRLHQVNAWMQLFFPGCDLVVGEIPKMNAVTLGIRTSSDTDFHRPVHVGFGLTQVLPIIVAVLSAKRKDIICIENPEVHLHPSGQALMGQFLALAAANGIQLLVESHSDHILSGIRRAVKKGEIAAGSVCLHFFRDRQQNDAPIASPQLDHFGNIDFWPAGFFDQFDKDMSHFAGLD